MPTSRTARRSVACGGERSAQEINSRIFFRRLLALDQHLERDLVESHKSVLLFVQVLPAPIKPASHLLTQRVNHDVAVRSARPHCVKWLKPNPVRKVSHRANPSAEPGAFCPLVAY